MDLACIFSQFFGPQRRREFTALAHSERFDYLTRQSATLQHFVLRLQVVGLLDRLSNVTVPDLPGSGLLAIDL